MHKRKPRAENMRGVQLEIVLSTYGDEIKIKLD